MNRNNNKNDENDENKNDHNKTISNLKKSLIIGGPILFGVVGIGAFIASRFKVVAANQFMAKTGFLVDGVHISRKTILWPFQEIRRIDMHPLTYQFVGTNIFSKEMIGFELPVKFNIAPIDPEKNLQGFINYATRVNGMTPDDVHALIENIIIGRTREYTANMTIEDIVRNKSAFKTGVVDHIKEDLEKNGFETTTANISDIKDPPGIDYFKNLMRKAISEANTSSSIAVAEAEKTRIVGEKNRQVETRKQESTLEATAKETESIQHQNISQYERDLIIMRTQNEQKQKLAAIDAHKATQLRQIEVESELNLKKQQQELERLRSEKVIKAIAEAEAVLKTAQMEADAIKIKAEANSTAIRIKADANLFERNRQADANLFEQNKIAEANLFAAEKSADAIKLKAEADLIAQTKLADANLITSTKAAEATKLKADADLIAQTKLAEGIHAQLVAQANGLEKIYSVSTTNPQLATFYLAMKEGKVFEENGLFDRLGKHQAEAINGLQPKIHIWNTGDNREGFASIISGLTKTVPPILDVLQQQTGIKLPNDWLSDQSKL